MAAISKISFRPEIERFYGSVFGKRASQAMKIDQEILANLSRLNIFEALGKLYYKGLIVTEVAALITIAACGVVVRGQDGPIETSVVAKPQIAYFMKDTTQGDPVLTSQLAGVQNLSGKGAGCNPAIVMVEGGNAGGETAGFCTKDNVITDVVVRRERDGTQQTVNEDLITRVHQGSDGKPDIAYIEYGSGNKKGTLFTYDYATKVTTWHFPSGGIVEFPAAQGPFEELIGKLLEPGGVAAAAEIDTPTPTATVTATALSATPTKDAPTPVPKTEVVHTVFDSAPFDNIGVDSWKRFVNSDVVETKDITPGLILQGTGIQHLTLVDHELNVEDNQTPMWVILGFTVEDKGTAYNYAFKAIYNPCPGGTVKLYPRRNSVLVKNAPYVVNAYTVKSVYDSALTIDTLGIGVGCDLIPELSPTDLYSLKDYFLGKDKGKAGTLLDLSSILYLGSLQEIK